MWLGGGMPDLPTTWATWRQQARLIDSDGLAVATYDLGPPDARTLTFLHGYPSSSLDIAAVANRLGDDWRVVALDFPGFGASAKPADHTYTVHAATDAVERLWAATGLTSTVVVAHDYGVSIGQELLARRAEGGLDIDIPAVVWMNGGLYPELHRPTTGQQLLLDDDTGAEVAASLTEDLFVSGVAVTWGERRPMDPGEIHEIWASMDDDGGVALMHDLLHYIADRRNHAQRWRTALDAGDPPMTFVWGDLDPVSGAHMIEGVEQRVRDARIIRLSDVGHWPLLEAPDDVAEAIAGLATG